MLDSVVTVGEITEQVGARQHRVQYILRTRGVKPLRKVSGTYIYAASVVELVRDAVARIDANRAAATV